MFCGKFNEGDTVRGYIINNQGEQVLVEGTFMFRTDDPEEYIQDIVIRLPNGDVQYIENENIAYLRRLVKS